MKSVVYGYVRVSTKEQCEERQWIALREFPVERKNIFMDKLSGKDFNLSLIHISLPSISTRRRISSTSWFYPPACRRYPPPR